jgi:hypothetical protein
MATTTAIYGLPTGVVADDFVEPSHQNKVADTLDRVLGNFLKSIMADGAAAGWNITEAAQVGAGEGLIAGCWCKTIAAQDISELTNNATNYVFGQATSDSPAEGTVTFVAQLSPTGSTGAIFLGTITLDASGEVTEFDNEAVGVDRNLMRLEIGSAGGEGCVEAVPAGDSLTIAVDHAETADFVVPGAINLQVAGEYFDYEVRQAYSATGFQIAATNTDDSPQDFSYTWTRHGLIH